MRHSFEFETLDDLSSFLDPFGNLELKWIGLGYLSRHFRFDHRTTHQFHDFTWR